MAVTEFREASQQAPQAPTAQVSVLVAIPAYNEGPTIGSVVLKAKQHADEVVVVDDGSTDDTAATAELAGAKVLRHARNLGKGKAVRTAWLYARERRVGAFVLLDGDHQHDPKDILRLAQPILEGTAEVVLGVRWGKTSGMPLYRRLGKRALDFATATGTRDGLLTDSQSGYRVFSGRSLASIEPTESGLAIESQLLLEAQEQNLRIAEVQIQARYDIKGSSTTPGKHGAGVLIRVLLLISEKRPLFFFGIAGICLITLSAVFGAWTAGIYYAYNVLPIGFTMLTLFSSIIGVLSVFVGVVLNALKRVGQQSE